MGGGAALAATGSDNPTSDFLGDVAKRLGISEDKLEGAIEDATIERIDAAVAAGEITKEEGEALKDRARSGDAPAGLPGFGGPRFGVGPVGPPPKGLVPGRHPGRLPGLLLPGFLPGSDLMETAADYLEMDAVDVRRALRDGKSLADLASAKGKSVDGLKDALGDEIRKDADRAVEKLSTHVDELVEQTGGPHRGPVGPPGKRRFPDALPGIGLMETAADYLEMDVAAVRDALHDGKSLADLAKDKGKSVEGLRDALREELGKDADRMVDKLVEGNLRDGIEFHLRGP
jgi:lambda repressor-like predicted transcriptional regulator